MENKNINPHLIRTDAKRSVKMKTKSKKSMNASFKNNGGSADHHVGSYRCTS